MKPGERKEWQLLVLCACLCACSGGSAAAPDAPVPYASSIGPYVVETETLDVYDGSRGAYEYDAVGARIVYIDPPRRIPVKLYAPEGAVSGTFPLVLVSHGLGGNADEAVEYMAEELAAHGYIVAAVQHNESDSEYAGSLVAAASLPALRALRPQDMSFVLDWLSSPSNTAGHIVDGRMSDFAKVGALGHSFGAWTTLACLGQVFDGGFDASDGRFICGVAYSPQAPGTLGVDQDAWETLSAPTLTMGGTLDTSPGTASASDRRAAFDGMPSTGSKYHATLLDAEHSDFGNEGRESCHGWIEQMTLAFFDAMLRGDAAAKAWLDSGDIGEVSSSSVTLERK